MHSLVRKVLDSLRDTSTRKVRRSARLAFELLEDRAVPTAGAGSITGLVYLNSQDNGVHGATISLNGTPTVGPAIPVNLTAVTDDNGAFAFTGLPAGNYQLTAGPLTGLIGTVSIGGVSASPGVSVGAPVAVGSGATVGQNIVIQGGFDPQIISMQMFLNITTAADFPFNAAGAGNPNSTPAVSTAIGAQALSATTTSKVIDLAGHFADPGLTDSAVTMNVTANGVAKQINVNLTDAATPQAVANFFDYVNAGAYNNSFFHRETTIAKDSFVALQGGGATVSPAGVLAPITSLGTIPDEVAASNTAGTLAMANTGAANSGSKEFFFNVNDNSAHLDKNPLTQQVGFTVFGKAADAASQAVLTGLAGTPVFDLSSTSFATSAHLTADETPLNATAPVTNYPNDASKYLVINSIVTTKRDDFLTYSIVSNSNAAAVTATLANEQLTLTRVAAGSANIVVKATDRFGASTTQTFTVTVS